MFNQGFFNIKFRNQVLATLCVNIIALSHGTGLGWISPILPILQSDDTPLQSGKVSLEETSWIGALLCVGGLIGNLIFGALMSKIGRKVTLLTIVVPHIAFWLTILFGNHVYHIFAARVLAGTCGGGLFVSIPIFIAEIAHKDIRGTLGSMFILMINVGILLGFILGSYLHYHLTPIVILVLPIIYSVAMSYFPQTPQYLLERKQINEAEASLRFYRNYVGDSKEEFQDFNKEFASLKASIIGDETNNTNKDRMELTWKDFWAPAARKGIIISLVLMMINPFSGTFAILNYSGKIFSESGSLIDSNLNTIIIGTVQVIGTYVATILVDRYGRKILLNISTFGSAIAFLVMGIYSKLSDYMDLSSLNWIPIVSLSLFMLLASIGITPLPFVVMAEVVPPKIRSRISTFAMCYLSVLMFAVLKVYPILMDAIQISGVMFVSAITCLLGTFFIVFYVPETKGKSLTDTEESSVKVIHTNSAL